MLLPRLSLFSNGRIGCIAQAAIPPAIRNPPGVWKPAIVDCVILVSKAAGGIAQLAIFRKKSVEEDTGHIPVRKRQC
jgi:hypothetical protein